jgi:hypothetical protein
MVTMNVYDRAEDHLLGHHRGIAEAVDVDALANDGVQVLKVGSMSMVCRCHRS